MIRSEVLNELTTYTVRDDFSSICYVAFNQVVSQSRHSIVSVKIASTFHPGIREHRNRFGMVECRM